MPRFLWLSLALMSMSAGDSRAAPADHPHPRLLWPKGAETSLHARVASDPLAARMSDACLARATQILGERTCRYEIPDGKRLLGESRRALANTTYSAWAWRMTGEQRFRQRTIRELDAACGLEDWNPKHFLDVAEMSLAVAIGYDWLFDSLTPAQRKRYEDAMIEKALKPARKVYQSGGWWSKPRNNWAQVCGAGIALTAAAVAERDPALCGDLFERGRMLIDACTRFYEPDGVYPEGPGYWGYGTSYHVLLLAACEELGIGGKTPDVLRKSGDFMMQVTGPTGMFFNYADCGSGHGMPSPPQFWIARQFHDNGQSRYLRDRIGKILSTKKHGKMGGRLGPLSLLWLPQAPPPDTPTAPRIASFRGEQPLAFFRTSWKPDAAWLAIKGGTPSVSHGHMDVGTFVFDSGGVRWFHDMGSDNYNMPGYFGDKRWSYFRLNNLSHNTLVIGGKLQAARATPAPMIETPARPKNGNISSVAFDLTPAYKGQAKRVVRRAEFNLATGEVLMEDKIDAPFAPARWAVVTRAKVNINGRRVILEQAGKSLTLTRLDAAGGSWTVTPATPSTARENQNTGFRILSFTAPKSKSLRLRVKWK